MSGPEEQDKKRQKTSSQGEEEEAQLDPQLVEGMQELEGIQNKLDEINDEALEKVFEVEREYNKKRRPVYAERQKVMAKVPNFWQQALLAHPLIRQMVTQDDVNVLEYCTEVDVEEFEDIKSGYKITLKFAPNNPYFNESQLVKEFHNKEEGEIHVHGNVPTWKPGMAPEVDQRESEKPSGREYRLMMWFVEDETLSGGQHDPLADIVKEEIWPNPIKYYNHEIDDESNMGGEEDSEDLSGEGEEGDDMGGDGEVYEEEGGEGEGEEEASEGQE